MKSFKTWTPVQMGSKLEYLPFHSIQLLCWFMLFIVFSLIGRIRTWTVVIGRSESTCGPARHPTKSWELRSSKSSLLEELLTDVMTPLTAMVAAQCHRQAQDWTRTRVRTRVWQCCWIIWFRIISWFRVSWFWGLEAFSGWFSLLFESWCFQQTAQSQIWGQEQRDQRDQCIMYLQREQVHSEQIHKHGLCVGTSASFMASTLDLSKRLPDLDDADRSLHNKQAL